MNFPPDLLMNLRLRGWAWAGAWLMLVNPWLASGWQPHSELRTITATGDALVHVVPDEVIVQLGVAGVSVTFDLVPLQ
jgi:hypothetical protein